MNSFRVRKLEDVVVGRTNFSIIFRLGTMYCSMRGSFLEGQTGRESSHRELTARRFLEIYVFEVKYFGAAQLHVHRRHI